MNAVKIPKNIFSKKVSDYTFAIMFFLIFSAFIIFAIRPSLTTATTLKREEFDLRRIDSLYENKIFSIATLQSQMEENRRDLPLLNQAISTYPQVNKMIEDIKDAADKNSLVIKKAAVSDVNLVDTKKKNLQELKVTIEGKGSFDDLLKFTAALFNQRRLKTIKKMVVSRDPESTASSQLKITLDIEGYYL